MNVTLKKKGETGSSYLDAYFMIGQSWTLADLRKRSREKKMSKPTTAEGVFFPAWSDNQMPRMLKQGWGHW